MDKLPVGQLPDLQQSNNDDEIMVITNSEYSQLKKEKISDLITDFTSTNENNALTKGTDGKMFVTDFGNASNITEGTLPTSVLPEIPLEKLPASGVSADTYAYPSSVTVNAQGMVTAISEGSPSGANANTDLSNITEAGKEVIRENSGAGFNMFDLVTKDHVLSFEESKGFALLGSYVYKEGSTGTRYGYPDFYNKCIAEKTAGTETQTKLGEATITTYNNSNGHIFYDIADKSTVDAYFESTGEAWFYGIDTTNERIFLPRTTRFQYTSDTSKVGEYQEAGLPNIEGSASGNQTNGMFWDNGTPFTSGAFKTGSKLSGHGMAGGGGTTGAVPLNFDASASNPIYGNSDTVTPSATNMLLYMVVGNTDVESAATDITDITTTENDTIPLFAPWYFDFEPNSVAWLKAGQQANSGSVYTTAYNTLVNELTTPTLGLKVIDVDDMVADTDYSLYWKVDQTNQTFTTPTRVSYATLSGRVMGNGMTLGFTNGSGNAGLVYASDGGKTYPSTGAYGKPAGTASGGDTFRGDSLGITTDPENSGIVAEQSTSQLYFKVANAVQNLQVINVGEITTALADKIGRTECKAYITETYYSPIDSEDRFSWYRLWSDGWLEQGGQGLDSNHITSRTFSFLKPYQSKPVVLAIQNAVPQTNLGYVTTGPTSTDVLIRSSVTYIAYQWYACGYAAQGE